MAKEETKSSSEEVSLWEKITPVLLIAVVVLAFLVGSLWQKVNSLQGGTTSKTQGTQANNAGNSGPSPLSKDSLVAYASEIGLDEGEFSKCFEEGKYEDRVNDDVSEGSGFGVTGTPSFFVNGINISGAQPYSVFEDVINYELAGGDWDNPSDDVAYLVDGNPNNYEISPTRVEVPTGDAPVRGDENAPVTIIEYSDFECPYCESFFTNSYGQIKENYVDTGDVKFVYKQFPLISIHPNAQNAAEASLCADEQGAFWEYHDKLFEASAS